MKSEDGFEQHAEEARRVQIGVAFYPGGPLEDGQDLDRKIRLTYRVQHGNVMPRSMIRSFRDRDAERVLRGERVQRYGALLRQVEKRLRLLDASDTLTALRMLPSNRLEALTGDRKGQFSIRINDQWRVCFEWRKDGAYNVEIVDYH